jgi:hypothetical protein
VTSFINVSSIIHIVSCSKMDCWISHWELHIVKQLISWNEADNGSDYLKYVWKLLMHIWTSNGANSSWYISEIYPCFLETQNHLFTSTALLRYSTALIKSDSLLTPRFAFFRACLQSSLYFPKEANKLLFRGLTAINWVLLIVMKYK